MLSSFPPPGWSSSIACCWALTHQYSLWTRVTFSWPTLYFNSRNPKKKAIQLTEELHPLRDKSTVQLNTIISLSFLYSTCKKPTTNLRCTENLIISHDLSTLLTVGCADLVTESGRFFNPYPTSFPYGNGMVLNFYQQQESSTTKTVNKVINKGLKTYV